jgi:DNA (cytosine-5)-methyltransferase 1
MRALAVSCGYASSVGYTLRPPTHEIEGRTVNQSDTYTVSFSPSSRSSFYDKGIRWQLVRKVEPTGVSETVYDLEIEGDHSYVADGIVVHNCQAFSVAGLRKGFADERGNLTLEFVRLAQRIRPRWLVWENVPGVLSIDRGRAFGSFLGGLAECGYGFAYRVLDAQHFGVPQRRRRVFVVGYLGDWRPPAAVLFERESLCRDLTPSRETGKRIAPTLNARTKGGGGLGTDHDLNGGLIAFGGNNQSGAIDVATAVNAHGGPCGRIDFASETFIAQTAPCLRSGNSYNNSDPGLEAQMLVTHPLRADGFDASEDGTGRGTPLIPVAYVDTLPTLRAAASQDGPGHGARSGDTKDEYIVPMVQPYNIIGCGQNGRNHAYATETSGCLQHKGLAATGNEAGTLIGCFKGGQGSQARSIGYSEHVAPTLPSSDSGSNRTPTLLNAMQVRRLTPRECERLQGFPDDFTLVPYRGKQAADGPRYKALGNSMAVPCMRWLGERIQRVEELRMGMPA